MIRGVANKCYLNVVAILTLGVWSFLNTPGAWAAINVPQWTTYEISLTATNSYNNPYLEVDVTATFTHSTCGVKTVKGFWDGGQNYKVRFTPTCTGTWDYSITNNKDDSGLSTSGSISSSGPPAAAHGFVRTDGYHFKFDDGSRYFMFGTTAYAMIANAMEGNNWQNTVDYLSSKGINKVRLLIYPWGNALDVKYADTQPFTGAKDSPDHDSLNLAHWQKFDEIIRYMGTKGIVADIIVFSDQDRAHGSNAQDERYTRYAIARFAAYPNVIWDLRNEYQLAPVMGASYWNNIGLIFRNEDPWMSENGQDRPLSIHGNGGTPANDFAGASWASHVVVEWGIAGSKGLNDPDANGQDAVALNYGYNKPVVEDEFGYTGAIIRSRAGQPIFDRTMNRQAIWSILTAGGYATMGDAYDASGNDESQYVGSGYANWLTGDYYPMAQYDDAARLINFWTAKGVKYWLMSSDNSLVQSGTRVYARAETGKQYVFYAAVGGSFTANVAPGMYDARRYNPRTGDDVVLDSKSDGTISFNMPDSNDWVVYLNANVPDGSTLLSQNQPITASSVENGSLAANNAVDGDTATRWASVEGNDPEWIYVDLGVTATITRVVLNWENAFGKAYEIQISNDAINWTTIYTEGNGNGGIDDVPVSGSGRYVRMYGTQRGTQWGYSLWEFEVYGTVGGTVKTVPQKPFRPTITKG
jgi:hypothetical protein